MSKLSSLMNVGKIFFGGAAAVLGIAALFTPLAPIVIVAAICAAIAYACDTGEDMLEKYHHPDDTKSNADDESDSSCNGDSDDDLSGSIDTIADHNSDVVSLGEDAQVHTIISEAWV